ncbi:hypothetical protein [Noviherbaspirillum aerium]|uniref:hypothetical protein n=1 Tax=Noviherbaspirillum aerium TaxID=2588497 RepID=UPI00124E2C8F|nr:hypothetical protein [Noviherbaspirillum aerium]
MNSTDDERKTWLASPQVQKMLFPELNLARLDSETEEIVEEGIRILESEGLKEASRFAYEHGVPLHVAKRVLLRPWERRVKY